MAQVTLTNVRKSYPNGFEAVKDLSLDIRDGEFLVLVGPSGCGKSTTLRMVAGLEEITAGTIAIGGRIVNDVHPKDRDIAMVFQNYALYPHMTVYKNMAFALTLRKVPKPEIERRVREAARTLGIEELLDRKPKALSGGQRQRVAVGRAIVREPKAFLFDEPLSNLDAKLRVTTRAELKALHQRLKTTTIYVTHDQEEAMTLGDRIVVMSKGLIQQSGPPLDVYRRPANRFVAGFVGTPPMNFLDGRLESTGGGLSFIEGSSDPRGTPYTLSIPATRSAALAPFTGKNIVLGLRPQMLREHSGNPIAGRDWLLPVRVVEPLGDSMDVSCGTPKHPHLVARISANATITAGSAAVFTLDAEAVHFFEPGEFGLALRGGT
ncbi:MAG: sn-glycerol-3-phosphate ABC transporter ATP-binding protein UgpC [Phycisphaerae bacterium]|nr:sn-glycerol-3-phosphate ABC transporter ATP-binding protein UgpC [Phycisphaerae bacterium]